jgi:hypothetical protein
MSQGHGVGQPPRCRMISLSLDEPLRGTASVVRSWVLLEHPGPWGGDALAAGRLPSGLGSALAEVCGRLDLRVVLIRRHGRHVTHGSRCFLGRAGPGAPWLEQVRLDDPREVLDLDLERLARGERCGLRPVAGPLFCVCTHGRHDPCCAENGRPVAHALAARYPARTWESSHIGGDRFAATLVCFPHGLYFGRVSPDRALDIARAYRGGTIELADYRGRCCWPFPVQAAEYWLREKTAIVGVDDLRLLGYARERDIITARFAGPGDRRWTVRVHERRVQPARPLTCRAVQASRPFTYDLLDIGIP